MYAGNTYRISGFFIGACVQQNFYNSSVVGPVATTRSVDESSIAMLHHTIEHDRNKRRKILPEEKKRSESHEYEWKVILESHLPSYYHVCAGRRCLRLQLTLFRISMSAPASTRSFVLLASPRWQAQKRAVQPRYCIMDKKMNVAIRRYKKLNREIHNMICLVCLTLPWAFTSAPASRRVCIIAVLFLIELVVFTSDVSLP